MYVVCCSCGLVHEVFFDGKRGKRAVIRMEQRPRFTAAYRRRARLKMIPRGKEKP